MFGVWSSSQDVAWPAYLGLYALQHRGEESAGIAVSDGTAIVVRRGMGLVRDVFDESALSTQPGRLAIGHCRYSTTGPSVWQNAQPMLSAIPSGNIALGHNGNLVNTRQLAELVRTWTNSADSDVSSDTLVLTALFARPESGSPRNGGRESGPRALEETALSVLPLLRGSFSLTFMDERTLFAARDPQGFRPLVLGKTGSGWVVASETAALHAVGSDVVREVEPGEMIAIDERGVRSHRFAAATPRGCVFEYVYLARPDSMIAGRGIHATRIRAGMRLAAEQPAEADLVIAVPDTGIPAALGYAQASGIPYGQGLIKNSYVGRVFLKPSRAVRQQVMPLKLIPITEVIAGHRVVVIDDSVVHGNTQRAIVAMLREAGATEVHVRIASPPVTWPCFYGVNLASRPDLIAVNRTFAEISALIGADTMGFISLSGLVESTGLPASRLCRACFDGEYPEPPDADTGDRPHVASSGVRRPSSSSTSANSDGS